MKASSVLDKGVHREQGAADHHWVYRVRGMLPMPLLLLMVVWGHPVPSRFFVGLGLVVIGLFIRLWAAGHIGLYRGSELEAVELVTSGPYARMRNPMAAANFVIGLGLCITSNWLFSVPLFLGLYAFMYGTIVRQEETFLEETFQDDYRAYKEHVPRWIPRLRRWPEAVGEPWRYAAAWAGERYTWLQISLIVLMLAARIWA